jgi:hypothetical protein
MIQIQPSVTDATPAVRSKLAGFAQKLAGRVAVTRYAETIGCEVRRLATTTTLWTTATVAVRLARSIPPAATESSSLRARLVTMGIQLPTMVAAHLVLLTAASWAI